MATRGRRGSPFSAVTLSWLVLLAGAATKRREWAVALGLHQRHERRVPRRDRSSQGPGNQDADISNEARVLDDNQVL